jgi:predicted PurR-regulated permease PerM
MAVDANGGPAPRRLLPSYMAMVLAAGSIVVLLWFLQKIVTALLLLFLALVVAIALAAPVDWLVRRGLGRRPAAGLVLLAFFATVGLVGWLVIPQLARQVVALVNSLPQLIGQIDDQIARLLVRYPELQGLVQAHPGTSQNFGPAALNVFRGVGGFSLSLLGAVALLVVFLSTVVYTVLDPRPVLRGYLGSLPVHYRAQGMRAYRRAARAVVGWTEASLILGLIEFVAVFAFLTWMEVPGALVWAALAFFAEFIPRIGGYIMAFPPIVVSLTQGPMTAVWVALFYLASNELLGNLVAPRIRGQTMRIHPVMLLFFTLAFALAFGLLGAIVATPAAAFFSAFYSEFYMKRRPAGS